MKEPALESPPEGESGQITGEEDVLGSPPCPSLASSEGGFGQTQAAASQPMATPGLAAAAPGQFGGALRKRGRKRN